MKPNDDEAGASANPQRRTILRGAVITGCAIGFPLLWGCKPKESANTATPPTEVPPPTTSSPPTNTDSSAPSENSGGKMSKAMAQYQSQPKGEQQCSNCMHFLAESNACTLVEGQIEPQAWCILWAKQPT